MVLYLKNIFKVEKIKFKILKNKKGNIIGMIRDPQQFAHTFKLLRRRRHISEFVSVCVSHSHKCVYLSSDGGRLCRPYIVVENRAPKLTQAHIDQLNLGTK